MLFVVDQWQNFRKGLHNYLKEFSYKNAFTGEFTSGHGFHTSHTHAHNPHAEDLWAHLAEASGKSVAMVMSSWTRQMGYPVVSIEGKQVCIVHTAVQWDVPNLQCYYHRFYWS